MTIEPTAVKLVLGAVATGVASSVFAMTFTASDLTALAAALAILVGALFTGVIGIITARAAAKATVKRLDEVVAKADVIVTKTDVIAGHVNSAASVSAAEIRDLRQQVEKLTQSLSESKTVARELAATTATTAAVTAAAHTVQAASVSPAAPVAKQEEQVQRMQRVTDETHELVTDLKSVDVPKVAENVDTLVQSIKKETS